MAVGGGASKAAPIVLALAQLSWDFMILLFNDISMWFTTLASCARDIHDLLYVYISSIEAMYITLFDAMLSMPAPPLVGFRSS